jgi:hypothetical protein
MYLWKCWRDTRIVLVASLLCIGVLFVSIVSKDIVFDHHAPFENLSTILPFALTIQAFPISFVAWLLGSFGVGRDLGERSGSYVFTRPKSRAYFVWCDWGVGMAQLLPIVALLNLVLGVLLHRIIVAVGDPLHGSVFISGRPVTLAFIVWLNFGAAYLLAGLVFSLTYFSTVIAKDAKGLIYGAGVLVGYLFLERIAPHYWPAIHLPNLVLQEFIQSNREVTGISNYLGVSVAIRAGIILLFPIAAQFVLQKTDVNQ